MIDTIGFTIHHPWEVINVNQVMENGAISFTTDVDDFVPVGIDEYSSLNGLSEEYFSTDKQKGIYYITGESRKVVQSSPFLEKLKKNT